MRWIFLLATLGLTSAAAAQDAEEGAALYLTYCAACHGETAHGEGRMAPLLTVLPPDLTQLSAANGGVFPTQSVAWQIDGRDPLLAHGGEMPLFGQFFVDDASVALILPSGQRLLTSRPIADVIAYLQSIQE